MARRREKSGERIDLGLEALLSVSQIKGEAQDVRLAANESGSKAGWTLGASQSSDDGEYNALADEGRWSEIVKRAESHLSEGDNLKAKVWWIRGHLGAFSMPVSFLAAPLTLVIRSLENETITPQVGAIVLETGLLALSRLREVNEKDQFDSLKAALEKIGIYEPKSPRERKRTGTSSFRAADFVSQAKATGLEVGKEQGQPGISSRRVLIGGSALMIILLALIVHYFVPGFFNTPLRTAREGFVSGPLALEQVVSVPGPKDPGGRLGALFYSIEGQRDEPPQISDSQTPAQPVVPQQGSPARQEGEQEKVASSQRPKERVNTAGPEEVPEFRERVERQRERVAGEDLPRRGSPPPTLPSDKEGAFQNEHTYSVLSRTPVLSAPSFGGKEIGYLERGDRVLVEGKLGRWLRLRSRRGRGGYVLAADVEEIPDGELQSPQAN